MTSFASAEEAPGSSRKIEITEINEKSNGALRSFMEGLKRRNPREDEFVQAVCEAARSVFPHMEQDAAYRDARILERMTEPDRIYRVSSRVGRRRWQRPRKSRMARSIQPRQLRFHKSVNQSVLKFLGFE